MTNTSKSQVATNATFQHALNNTNTPQYLALDSSGKEYSRPPRTIGELPHAMVMNALQQATTAAEAITGITRSYKICYGTPVYAAFGLRLCDAKRSEHSWLLMLKGCDIPLDVIANRGGEV
jgi:hypothetical protein